MTRVCLGSIVWDSAIEPYTEVDYITNITSYYLILLIMNTVEPTSSSLLSLYKERLNHLSQTLVTLHAQISAQPSITLFQSHPALSKHQTDRINELAKEIISDERQVILIACLEAYHKLKFQIQANSLNRTIEARDDLSMNDSNLRGGMELRKKDIERIEMNYQLDEARCEIKKLKEELALAKYTKSLENQDVKNSELERSSLQSVINSLNLQNKRLLQDLQRSKQQLKTQKLEFKRRQQKLVKEAEETSKQLIKAQMESQSKNSQLTKLQKQLRQAEEDSLSQKIYLSDKYSYLTRHKSTQSIRPYSSSAQFQPKTKFRVAEFQELCYEMSKQEQQLKVIRSNFSKFGQMLQHGVKSHLQQLRKIIIGLKSMVENQVKEGKRQVAKYAELFEGKANKILSQQKIAQTQKLEQIKNLYQQQMILLEEKRKIEQSERKSILSGAEIKIKDERIHQLEDQIHNIRCLQGQYKQLLVANQQLQSKLQSLKPEPVRQSKHQPSRPKSPPYLQVSPPLIVNPSILEQSKSLSPKAISKIFQPHTPHLQSRTNFNSLRFEHRESSSFNPQVLFDHPIKDSRTRKQLQNGFNELQEQIQAIIQRRNKRNARNAFRYQ